ncbi:hypothetical protein C8Q80DRAFT_1272461 [Daedaleopsis nitida]|nr:hypothetical protein C8Q80DRAFT_1272461 [Daedaleopsis nitida]
MSQQVESAVPTRLASISSRFASRKLRVAGWLLHDDAASATIMIYDGEDALLVDISLCVTGYRRALWLRESKTAVMALGYLEASREDLPLPVLHSHAPLVNVNPHLILRAIVVEDAKDLDMALWNRAIRAREDAASHKTASADES